MDEKDGTFTDDFTRLSIGKFDNSSPSTFGLLDEGKSFNAFTNYGNNFGLYSRTDENDRFNESKNDNYFVNNEIDDNLDSGDATDSMHRELLSKFNPFRNNKRESRIPNHLNPNYVPKIHSQRNDLNYYMGHKHRGKCVIINNTYFDSPTLPERKGTQVDRDHLTNCFKKLDFDVLNWDELSALEIKIKIDRLAKEDFTEHDCLIVCVLTHGDSNCLYAKDDKYYVDYLFDSFKSDLCRSLAGKPKVFIIQACRGDRLDNGSIINFDVEDSNSSDIRIPQWADFLMAYSTVPGFYSWRNTTNGSWFIQAFVSALIEHFKELDLLSIFTITNQKVAYDFESNTPNLPDFHQRKQIPMIASMLTRKLYLNKPKPKKLSNLISGTKATTSNSSTTITQIKDVATSANYQQQSIQNAKRIMTKEELIKEQIILNEKMISKSNRKNSVK